MTDPAVGAPVVSVVLPTFQRPDLLPRAIASVQAQSLSDWELIVVDDNDPGSEARRATASWMQAYATDARVRYLAHDANRGGGAARNTGIEAARADLVAFLDDDDAWHPDKLERQVRFLARSSERVALVYGRMEVEDGASGASSLWPTDGVSHGLRQLLRRNTIGSTSCVVCRRAALLEVGMFDATLPSKQDIDLYVRLAERFEIGFVDGVLLTRHVHGGRSIGKDLGGTILAHRLFFEKHRAHIVRYPEVLHHRLSSWGGLLAAAGRHREARPVLWAAWRVRPFDRRTLGHLAVAYGAPRDLVAALARGFRPRRTRAGLATGGEDRP
jgi:glycosyltransferase involved in cell wall biosynthesis